MVEAYNEAKELVAVGNFYKSETILTEVLDKDGSFDEAIVLLHEVYLKRSEPERANAIIGQYAKEIETPFLGRLLVLQANYAYQSGDYQQANKLLSNIKGNVSGIDSVGVEYLKRLVSFSIDAVNNPEEIIFEKLPQPLNKFTQQYFPSVTTRGQLVFTMRDQLGRGDENLYTSRLVGDGQWSEPTSISFNINTDRNEGTASISADGKTLVFTSCNRPNNIGSCDLYISYLINGNWTEPELLGEEVNSESWDSQPSLTATGNTLYFVSTREGGLGKQDIWKSEKVAEEWTQAVNLGEQVNTKEDDCSPFIYLDGETLIYSSRGRIGLGGYDLFKSILTNNNWSEPENLGYPINNAFDQIGYCISADQWAYFSSSDESGQIYLQRFKVPETLVPEVIAVEPVYGKVISAVTGNPLSAEVRFLNRADTVSQQIGNDGGVLLNETDFESIITNKRGYWQRRMNRTEFLKDSTIRLEPIQTGIDLLKSPIEFEFDSDVILPQARQELDRIINLLSSYPEIHVEIQGYTDVIGDSEYNQTLSELRARAVFEYITNYLDYTRRISWRGYGETKPQSQNGTNDRRVEITITKVEQ